MKLKRLMNSLTCLKWFLFMVVFLLLTGLLAPLSADPTRPPQKERADSKNLLLHIQYGWPQQYVSEIKYSHFIQTGLGLSYEEECGYWPFFNNHWLIESLLLELRFSRIWGRDIPLAQDQVSKETWEASQRTGKKPTTDWDHYQLGLTPYYRLYAPVNRDLRFYLEMGLGLACLNKPLIDEGTKWNFLISGGLGLDWKIYKIPFYSFVRFEHFSNGGKLWKEGLTDKRVIGPESMILGLGIRFPFELLTRGFF